jgi:hypothetical protein
MKYPFFSDSDPSLIRIAGGRDVLGLQPVWSRFGRALVPNLASPVYRLNGIKAVLLIHWLADTLQIEQKKFRAFFRLMEGLVEYVLWQTRQQRVCFGSRALAQGEAFTVDITDSRTVANGLYQYYRGSCRRARLLCKDWHPDEAVALALQRAWPAETCNLLNKLLEEPLVNKDQKLSPAAVLGEFDMLLQAFEAVFGMGKLDEILRQRLLGESAHIELAKKCASVFAPSDEQVMDGGMQQVAGFEAGILQLHDWLNQKDSPARALRDEFAQMEKCEPFLVALQICYDYLRASSGIKIEQVTKDLGLHEETIRNRAAQFLTLPDTASGRMQQVRDLAMNAQQDLAEFLRQLLLHHKQCMEERGKDPQVVLEGDSLQVLVAAEVNRASILERLEQGFQWSNRYYLDTAGNIYRQLFEVANER